MNELPAAVSGSPILPLSRTDASRTVNRAAAIFAAAQMLLPILSAGRPLSPAALRKTMKQVFGHYSGSWLWKEAYEASEAATVLFLQHFGPALVNHAAEDGPARILAMLERISALEPVPHEALRAPGPAAAVPPPRCRSPMSPPQPSTSSAATSSWNPPPAPASSQPPASSSPKTPGPSFISTRSPKPGTPCSAASSRAPPSHPTTPRPSPTACPGSIRRRSP